MYFLFIVQKISAFETWIKIIKYSCPPEIQVYDNSINTFSGSFKILFYDNSIVTFSVLKKYYIFL